jgi:ribosomal protein S18 acetylase RimI-like enzyme
MLNVKTRRFKDSDKEQVKNLHRIALKSTDAYAKTGNWESDLDNIPDIYFNNGEFLVGLIDDQIIVMGALKQISKEIVEMKRVRVHPDFQKQGLGQMMLELLEKRAKKLGYKIIQLDTTVKQVAAIKMYEKNGYVEIRRETEGWPLEVIFYHKQLK